jgi:hypothetical protein
MLEQFLCLKGKKRKQDFKHNREFGWKLPKFGRFTAEISLLG